jgi:hypothetical protein
MALFLYLFNVNVHLLDGLFLEAHEMKKVKEMYLDVVVGEMQNEEINVVVNEMQDEEINVVVNEMQDEEINVVVNKMQDEEINVVVNKMQDDFFFLKGEHLCNFFVSFFVSFSK